MSPIIDAQVRLLNTLNDVYNNGDDPIKRFIAGYGATAQGCCTDGGYVSVDVAHAKVDVDGCDAAPVVAFAVKVLRCASMQSKSGGAAVGRLSDEAWEDVSARASDDFWLLTCWAASLAGGNIGGDGWMVGAVQPLMDSQCVGATVTVSTDMRCC